MTIRPDLQIDLNWVTIPAGTFTMGSDDGLHPEDGEGPARPVTLSGYRIAATTITVAQFAEFVRATGYESVAEAAGASMVFSGELADPDAHPVVAPVTPWWRHVAGASWRAPQGDGPADPALPVVHIAQADALAYCHWSGTRLPTEAEWECAAQHPAGEPEPTRHIWQGRFPDAPSNTPGPVAVSHGIANAHGLLHACGNVWEWTADHFTRLHGPQHQRDPKGPLNGHDYVVKGGSFLCCPSYCARFRPSSRRAELPVASASNLGFRVAVNV